MSVALALLISGAIAGIAWLLRALTVSGSVAALAVGTIILSHTGWPGCAVLGIFFGSSTVVSRIAALAQTKTTPPDEIRNWAQVLSNGGAAAIGAAAERVAPGFGLWLVTTSLAAAAADTWATAFGSLSQRPPRDIVRRTVVPKGTSGGVTWFGTIGGIVGAALVALVGATTSELRPLYGAGVVIGFLGMGMDSVIGSALQAKFECVSCGAASERPVHRCGAGAELRSGWRWLDNSMVNAVATTFAALAGVVTWYGIGK